MAAKRTRCSPAGPIAMASASAPSAATSAVTVSRVVRPHSAAAGFTTAPSSVTTRYDGAAARPVTQTASKPVRFSVAGKRPPHVDTKNRPVSGDFAATSARLVAGSVVSGGGPTAKTTALAGSKASTPAGTRS